MAIACDRFDSHADTCRRNLAGAGGEIDRTGFDTCRYIAHTELYGNDNERARKNKMLCQLMVAS